jgi:protein TonB
VRDVDGSLPGAQVSLRRRTGATSIVVSTVTDVNGEFELREVPAGQYDFEVRLPGFRPVTRSVELAPEARMHEELMLQVGAVAETITVVADFNGPTPDQLAGEHARAAEAVRMAGARNEQAEAVRDITVVLDDGRALTRVGGNIQPPRKTRDVKPVYPAGAVAAGAVGLVVLQATIGTDGRVGEITPLRSPLHPELTQAAIDAVSGWEFTPTRLNGRPIAVDMLVTVSFAGSVP